MSDDRRKEIENKLNKEVITSSEFKEYFYLTNSHNKASREINKFCQHYNIDRDDLKDGKPFSFKPLWNGYFFLLFDTFFEHPLFHGNKESSNVSFEDLAELDIEFTNKAEKFLPKEILEVYKKNYLYKSSKVRELIIKDFDKKLDTLKKMIRLNPVNTLVEKYDDISKIIEILNKLVSNNPGKEGFSKRIVLDGIISKEEYKRLKKTWYKSNKFESLEEQVLSDFKFLLNMDEDPVVRTGFINNDEIEYKKVESIQELIENDPDKDFIKSLQVLFHSRIKGRPIPEKMIEIEKKLKE